MSEEESLAATPLPKELVAFCVAEQEYCVDIMAVREIRGWTVATKLPHAPAYVRGVINLRGSVLPIIDLACRLGLPPREARARDVIIVTQIREQEVGLLVESVSDILTIVDETIQPTPDVASETAKSFVRGVLSVEDRMIRYVDLEKIMPPRPSEAA